MDSPPIATMPKTGASPICTAEDQQGKQSWVMKDGTVVSNGKVVSNGTPGQVLSAAVPQNAQQKWQSDHKMACQKSWLSWMANCSTDGVGVDGGHPELPVEVSKVYAGASGGGADGSISYGSEGVSGDYAYPIAPGVQAGSKGITYGIGEEVPKAYVGLCVKWKGKKEEKQKGPKVETEVSGGILGASANNEGEMCGQLQTPAPPAGSVSMKPPL